MRTIACIYGFNLYYGALEGTAFKWLDLAALVRLVLGPEPEIVRVKSFTAKVNVSESDPGQRERQETYLRALREPRPDPAAPGLQAPPVVAAHRLEERR